MKYKRFIKLKYQYKYYNLHELSKIKYFTAKLFFLQKSMKISSIDKAYSGEQLIAKCSLINYCILSGRSKSLVQKFNISRIQLRDLVSVRLLIGLKKISW